MFKIQSKLVNDKGYNSGGGTNVFILDTEINGGEIYNGQDG